MITSFLKNKLKANRNFAAFLVCLLLAIVFWLLIAMNRLYDYSFKTEISYQNSIYGIDAKKTLPAFCETKIKANGFKIFWFWIEKPFRKITVDLKPFNASVSDGRIHIPLSRLAVNELKTTSYNNVSFSFSPEIISIPVASGDFKKVPVRVNVQARFSNQFGMSGSISAFPDSIIVSADSQLLQNIFFIETPLKTISNPTGTVLQRLALINPDSKNYFLSDDSVEVTIPVDQLTEGTAIVKLVATESTFTLIPSEVKLIYKTTVKNYKSITADSFLVRAQTEKATNGKARVQVVKSPANAEVVFIDPPFVTCLTKK